MIPSKVQVLTNVGLEHTRWLGPDDRRHRGARSSTSCARAATLVVGADLHPDAMALAEAMCAERGAKLVVAPADAGSSCSPRAPSSGATSPWRARRPRPTSGRSTTPPSRAAAAGDARARAASRSSRRRPRRSSTAPTTPAGMAALAEVAARRFAAGRRIVACVSVLDDKDAAGMLRELLPLCAEVVFTPEREPAGAAAGDARVARRPGRRAAGPDGRRPAAARSKRRARPRARTASRSRPARSTSSPTCCARPGARRGGRCCERRRPVDARDDRRWWRSSWPS